MTNEFKILRAAGDFIEDHGTRVSLSVDELRAFYSDDDYVILPVGDLPVNFSTNTYTIKDGKLVKASDEVIVKRKAVYQATANVAEIERLKAYLISTDWTVVKCIECGVPLSAIYPDIATKRNAARTRINELEGGANE